MSPQIGRRPAFASASSSFANWAGQPAGASARLPHAQIGTAAIWSAWRALGPVAVFLNRSYTVLPPNRAIVLLLHLLQLCS